MRIKFIDSYADEKEGFKAHHEYDFIDIGKANYFVDHGLAIPIEALLEKMPEKKTKRGNVNANPDSDHESK